jgi:peptide/nickel transport system permease protein
MKFTLYLIRRLVRTASIVLLVVIGSTVLVRYAPGYLSDAREMDPRYANIARAELSAEGARSASLSRTLFTEIKGWTRLDLGVSRQYDVPVTELLRSRLAVTGNLLLWSILSSWFLAICAALLANPRRSSFLLWQTPAALLLATPVAALATICLLADSGGPILVMTLLLAARDFKFLDRLLRRAWLDSHLLQARAQGIPTGRLLRSFILPGLVPQLAALATLSIVTALSLIVPVEVIFNTPGLGQLAWNAAMNRDLPILLAITVLMALAVSLATMFSDRPAGWQSA